MPGDKKLTLLALYLVFFCVLLYIYVIYTSTTWSYMGLYLRPNIGKIISSVVVLLSFVLATPTQWNVKALFLNIIVTSLLVPSLILYGFGDRPTASALLIWSSLAVVYVASSLNLPRLRVLSVGPIALMNSMTIMSAILIAMFVLFGGLQYFNIDFTRVYDFREEAAASLPGIFEYISSTFGKTVIPFGVAIALYHRNYAHVAILTFISFLMFGFTSHKLMVFTPVLIIGTYILMSLRPRFEIILATLVGLLLIILIGFLFDRNVGITSMWGWMESIIVRRSLFIPAMLDYSYIDVFRESDKYYWSTSKLTLGLVDAPNNGLSPPELVGSIHFGSNVWANTGFIGSGFAQAGLSGSIIYSICVGLVIAYFDSHGRQLSVPLVASATLGLFTTMVQSSDFAGMLLTHGLLLALVILTFVREDRSMQEAAGRRRRTDPARRPAGTGEPRPGLHSIRS